MNTNIIFNSILPRKRFSRYSESLTPFRYRIHVFFFLSSVAINIFSFVLLVSILSYSVVLPIAFFWSKCSTKQKYNFHFPIAFSSNCRCRCYRHRRYRCCWVILMLALPLLSTSVFLLLFGITQIQLMSKFKLYLL